jgi:hypothetical protein
MDSILMYDLAWKSETACAELFKSEYFKPKNITFKRSETEIKAVVEEKGIYFETSQKSQVIATLYLSKNGKSDSCRFY